MKDAFKFHTKNGTTVYTAVKISDGDGPSYLVSWDNSGIGDEGSCTYKVSAINRYIDDGTWVIIESPEELFSQEIAPEKGVFTVNINTLGQCAGLGLVSSDQLKESLTEKYGSLGVARPVLETRKIGKIPMHMVIDGFPLALKEVAKVMEWAERVKGYKLHDWRNLPDPEIAFPSAGYRHMIDNSEMKCDDIPALERVDHESGIVHLAHEIFNKVAELQLVMSGKIK